MCYNSKTIWIIQVMGISATENDAALIRDKGVFTSFKFEERKLIKHIEELATEKNITDIFKGEKGKYFKEVLNWSVLSTNLIYISCMNHEFSFR